MSSQTSRSGWLVLLVLAMVVVAACTGEEGVTTTQAPPTTRAAAATPTPDAPTTTGAPTATAGPTTTTSVASGIELPEALTIPIPDGGEVTMAGGDPPQAFAAAQYPIDRFDEIVNFYQDWTSSDAREWTFSESTADVSGATARSALWISGDSAIAAADCGPAGQLDAVCVTIEERG